MDTEIDGLIFDKAKVFITVILPNGVKYLWFHTLNKCFSFFIIGEKLICIISLRLTEKLTPIRLKVVFSPC